MTTVGYGDVVPLEKYEKLYAMATMLISWGIFAYLIGSIGSMIQKQSSAY